MELKEDFLYHIWQYRLFELPLMDIKFSSLGHPNRFSQDSTHDLLLISMLTYPEDWDL